MVESHIYAGAVGAAPELWSDRQASDAGYLAWAAHVGGLPPIRVIGGGRGRGRAFPAPRRGGH